MTIREDIMRYLGVFILYLQINTTLKIIKKRSHPVQKVMENDRAEIRVNTRIRIDILVKNNRPDIFIYDKKENEIILDEVGITSQDEVHFKKKKKSKYNILKNELC
ncbi:hypothetical protein TCON_1244 [Astathelohania contejeani]|uniref:Uncharacterized protein n=1 Tax=Astathelohania contejeani TaxID=164912 RepID=A0ABQ7HZC9_9MICR|nr:hypothetical protein TCON_1244 [Thelohania contejeani]